MFTVFDISRLITKSKSYTLFIKVMEERKKRETIPHSFP